MTAGVFSIMVCTARYTKEFCQIDDALGFALPRRAEQPLAKGRTTMATGCFDLKIMMNIINRL